MTEKGQLTPTPLRREAVGGHVNDGLQLHAVIELPVGQAGTGITTALADQPFVDSGSADIHPIHTDLQRRIVREEVGGLAPISLVQVVTVGALELLHLVDIVQPLGGRRQGGKPGVEGRNSRDVRSRGGRCAQANPRAGAGIGIGTRQDRKL